MIIKINRKKLQSIINICKTIIKNKPEIEVFGLIKFETVDKNLFVSVTNGKTFITAQVESNIPTDNNILFFAKANDFSSAINAIHSDTVNLFIDLDKNIIKISNKKIKIRLNSSYNIDNYTIPEIGNDNYYANFSVNYDRFVHAIARCRVALGTSKTVFQPEFLGYQIDWKEGDKDKAIFLRTTDRYRINSENIKVSEFDIKYNESTESPSWIINPDLAECVHKCYTSGADLEVETDFSNTLAYINKNTDEEIKIISQNISGKSRDFNRIIPSNFEYDFELKTSELINAIKSTFWCSDTENHPIKIEYDGESDNLIVSSIDAGKNKQSEYIIENINRTSHKTTSFIQSFNSTYLLNYLSTIETYSEYVDWHMNPGKPSILQPKDLSDDTLYLVSGLL